MNLFDLYRFLHAVDQYIYDNTSSAQHLRTQFGYDAYGNLSSKYDLGDVAVAGDERFDGITYDYDQTNWQLARPSLMYTRTTATPSDETDLSRTSMTYYTGKNLVLNKTFWHKEKAATESDPVISYGYYNDGNPHTQTDPKGNVTTYQYEATATFPSSVQNAAGHTVLYQAYNYGIGKPTSVIDVTGHETKYFYDALGRPEKVVGPADSVERPTLFYTYSALGIVGQQNVKVTARENSGTDNVLEKSVYFDGLGREIATLSDGAGGTIVRAETWYNASGQVSANSVPYFTGGVCRLTRMTYDDMGRLLTTTKPDGSVVSATCQKGVTTFTGPGNRRRVEQKDARGLLVAVIEYPDTSQAGVQTSYGYDALGRLVMVTDSLGKNTVINYDTLSRKRGMSDPAMGTWTYAYDANGNLASQTDAKNQTINFAYDAINRLATKTYPNNTSIGYEYDNAPVSNFSTGKLTRVTDASGMSEFSYPEIGVRTVSKTVTGINNPFVITTVNDALGRVSMIRYPDNEEVNYTYDGGGNLETVGDYATFGNYSALGQPGTISYGNSVVTGMTYNDGSNATPVDYRLRILTTTLPADGTKQNYAYTYDLSGNITDIEDLVETAKNRHFTYDGLNRLIEASWPNDSQAQKVTMEYYSNGNIKSKTGLGSNPSSSPLTGHDLVYDYDNRLKEISGPGIQFVYDFQGARVKKILGTPPITTAYIGNLYECTGSVYTKHIFAGGRRIASKTDTTVIYHHPDHLGGLHLATGSDGSLLQTATYYPFGENNEGSDGGIKYKFTGQEKDFESGLYYYGARFYDPAIGRFISPDTLVQAPGDPQTLNRYAYCRNNPLIYTDPTGHDFGFFTILAILALGAGAGATIAAIRGTDIGMGALTGAISAGVFLIAGAGVAQLTAAVEAGAMTAEMANLAAVGLHAGAGALSGTLNSAITGGDLGMGALTGGISGGIGKFAGNFIPQLGNKFANYGLQVAGRSVIGGISGGISAEIYGGNFGQGFGQGAWTAGFGTAFNDFGVITGTLLCTALSFGIAWAGTRIASWAIGNPSAAPTGAAYGDEYRVSNVTSDLTIAAGALTVSAEALVMGGIAAAPAAGTFGLSYAPQINQFGLNAVDFLNGYLPGTPPPSRAGYIGGWTSQAKSWLLP